MQDLVSIFGIKFQRTPEEKDYDAFVAFCCKDADWVFNTLMSYLEAPQCGFHICVHDRDFVPGVAITKNIMTAIQYSRRTILVLTPEFLKSGWCDLEFQAAHCRALEDRSNFLIIVLLKEVDENNLDETLKPYMKTNTYVSVDDEWFWQKIVYAMPKVPIDKLKAQQLGLNDEEPQNNEANGNEQLPGDLNDERFEDEDVPLLHETVDGQPQNEENGPAVRDDVLINIIDGKMEGNGTAVHYHDHISDVSSF